MSRIRTDSFLGIAPKVAAHLLAPNMAQAARDCVLWSQGLRAIDGLGVGAALSKIAGEIQTLYRYQGTWLCWTQFVNAVKGPIANDPLNRLYFTGTDKPRVTTSDIFNLGAPGTNLPPASYILGLPTPLLPPVSVDGGGAGNLNGAYTWASTYVRKFSDGSIEESAPSPPSNPVLALANRSANVTVPNDAIVFANYGITHKRIYRSSGGNFFFVMEIAIANVGVNNDNVATGALGDAVESSLYLPPPDGLAGLINLPNRVLAGFYQNVVYLSEPGRPHAYPLLNRYVVNDNIVALGNIGTTVVAITASYPEIGLGVDPSAYNFTRQPGLFPCTNGRSAASSELGVLWSTPSGMAICDGAAVAMATNEFLTKKEWGALFYPTTIHGTMHDGRYYGWFSTGLDAGGNKVGGGFVLDKTERAFLTTLGTYMESAYAIPDTDEMFVSGKVGGVNEVFQWDFNANVPLSYLWKSKEFVGGGTENFAFAQIIAEYSAGLTPAQIAVLNAEIAAVQAANAAITDDDGEINGTEINGPEDGLDGDINGDSETKFLPAEAQGFLAGTLTWKYYANGVLKQIRLVSSNDPFPMPSGFEAQIHEYSIEGGLRVKRVAMASSMEELSAQ